MRTKLRLLFHDETHEDRKADDFEVENGVLHIWCQPPTPRGAVSTRHDEAWYPLNSLRGWEWVED